METRTFEDKPAVREQTPLLVGIMGPSGGGKTYSSLRLATGIQRVTGGEIYFVDTEARRALHYAESFKFRHIDFKAPFGPLDYLAAIEHCVAKGAKTIIVDSLSHEHEGPGGVLEMHDEALERMGGQQSKTFLAWKEPKMQRRRLLNTMLQMPVNFIVCFRAKEKLKLEKGKDPLNLGFMPICGEEFVFEMTANCLLLPKADGIPTWLTDFQGEKLMMKLPLQFQDIFKDSQPLSESIGEQMAQWARGGATKSQGSTDKKAPVPTGANAELLTAIQKAITAATAKRPDGVDERAHKQALMEKYWKTKSWKDIEAMTAKQLEDGLFALKSGEEIL